MTGDEAARALEALAIVIRIRTSVSAHEVVDALSAAMGVARVDGPMSNAEKCRQYRHRKRHREGVATVSNGVALVSPGVAPSESPDLTYQVESVSDSSKTPISSRSDLLVHADTESVSPTVSRKRRLRRCPVWWHPNELHRSIARTRGVDFDLELEKFRDHEFARGIAEWDAAFRNWLRRATPARAAQGFKSAGTLLMERSARIAAEEGEKIPAFPLFGGRQ